MDLDLRRFGDIVACAEELAGYVDGMDEDAFVADGRTARAAERLLTIIGEAAKNLSDDARGAIDQPWREIIRFRDKGVHHYDALSRRTLFAIATQSVPELATSVKAYLEGKGKD